MGFTKVLAKHSNKTVRLDTYQRLLLTAIDSYGNGIWEKIMYHCITSTTREVPLQISLLAVT
ncbi:MAG: hypothetical protein CM15mV13_0040 [uncultured marine virus]|nr:MAG: hypothetical protein CM15mV13_0040 [uncultured marine virus]